MNNTISYKQYIGSVEFSEEDNMFYGKVPGIRSLISYEGGTAKEFTEDFHHAVDDYLVLCKEKGIEPEKSYKGSFNVRISPELHRELAVVSYKNNDTLNASVEKAIQSYVNAQKAE